MSIFTVATVTQPPWYLAPLAAPAVRHRVRYHRGDDLLWGWVEPDVEQEQQGEDDTEDDGESSDERPEGRRPHAARRGGGHDSFPRETDEIGKIGADAFASMTRETGEGC